MTELLNTEWRKYWGKYIDLQILELIIMLSVAYYISVCGVTDIDLCLQFPYQGSTSGSEPTKPLKSLVNIRKDSLKFVKWVSTVHRLQKHKSLVFDSKEDLFSLDIEWSITCIRYLFLNDR